MPPATDSDEIFPLMGTAIGPAASLHNAHESIAAMAPQPTPKPVLPKDQKLARISPQPERLIAVMASRAPLLEAARPLLDMLMRMIREPEVAASDISLSMRALEVTAFQSVCQDARIPFDEIVAASYMLCTALDDVLNNSAWGKANESATQVWLGGLAIEFHGDNGGGVGVFRILGYLLNEPQKYLDLLELMLLILALGFKGVYRKAPNGQRLMDSIAERVYTLVYVGREGTPSPRWDVIERLLKDDVVAINFSEIAKVLFA